MGGYEVELNRFIDVISLLPQQVEASISQFVQSFGAAPLAALLLIPILVAASEPIREVWIHGEAFAASRLSMMRIMARRMNAATVVA
jgi:hypothetical protein